METPLGTQTSHDRHGRHPEAATIEDFRRNLTKVQKRIDGACRRAGRDHVNVRLLPVSKTFDETYIRLAYAAGCCQLGENKVQKALSRLRR